MKFNPFVKEAVFAALLVSLLTLAVREAGCVTDDNWQMHGDLWWTNFAYVGGERDGYIPNKYFDELHDAYDSCSGFNVIDYTEITFTSDQYTYSWENAGSLWKDEEYHYWCGYARTIIYGEFRNWFTGAQWSDTAKASIKATGGPE